VQFVRFDTAEPTHQCTADSETGSVVDTLKSDSLAIKLSLDAKVPFAANLGRDARPEAYRLEVDSKGVGIKAVEPEGLLRAAATLLQIIQVEKDVITVPELTITDWPNFRYRCASDWLINAEINRWSYDWGDGRQAYLARVKRKLDLCFAYKINQVWFDGFGWDTQRSEGYADLMRECTGYARKRGIRLTFAGYGGGYGTSYQKSELYRSGYFGRTFFNRRPYPDGGRVSCIFMISTQERMWRARTVGSCVAMSVASGGQVMNWRTRRDRPVPWQTGTARFGARSTASRPRVVTVLLGI